MVVDIGRERKSRGAAIAAIVHHEQVRDNIVRATVDVTCFATAA